MVIDDGELVDDQPVVVLHLVEIEEARDAADDAAFAGVLNGDAVDEECVEGAVGGKQGERGQAGELAKGVINGGGREGGVEAGEGGAQAGGEEDLLEGVTLGAKGFGVDVLAAGIGVAQAGEPVDGGLLDNGFGEVGHW